MTLDEARKIADLVRQRDQAAAVAEKLTNSDGETADGELSKLLVTWLENNALYDDTTGETMPLNCSHLLDACTAGATNLVDVLYTAATAAVRAADTKLEALPQLTGWETV